MLGCGINNGKIGIRFTQYTTFNVLFIGFTLLSSLWAISASDSVVMARTLMRIFICAYMVYITYLNTPELDEMVFLKSVMWAGYIVSLYSLSFYGLDRMIVAGSSNLRISNEFANVNTIGLACALSCVIQINFKCLSSKKHFSPSALLDDPERSSYCSYSKQKSVSILDSRCFGIRIYK